MRRSHVLTATLGLSLPFFAGCAVHVDEPELAMQEEAILNGRPAGPSEQWGTIGFLIGYDGNYWLCAGTLVAPDLIVTAAHCLVDQGTGEPPDSFQVVAGASDIDAPEPDQIYEASRVVAHPEAALEPTTTGDPTGLGARNDLALVRTTRPITQVDVVPILPLDQVDQMLVDGAELIIAGYGRRSVDEFGISSDDGLHYVGALSFARRTEHEFLAGGSTQSDTCPGDSGGPVYVRKDGQVWLVGATSRGRDDFPSLDCGQGGIYTLVPAYADWISASNANPMLSDRAWTPLPPDPDDEVGRQPICSLTGPSRTAPGLLGGLLVVVAALVQRRVRGALPAQARRS